MKEELMSDYDPGGYVMPFGQHTGRTLADIGSNERGVQYLHWLMTRLHEKPNSHLDVRAALMAYLMGETGTTDMTDRTNQEWPTMEDAKELAGRYRKRGVIILSFSDDGMCSAGWGWQRVACDAMRKIGEQVIKMIGDGRIEP